MNESDAQTRDPRRITSLENEVMDPMGTTVRKKEAYKLPFKPRS